MKKLTMFSAALWMLTLTMGAVNKDQAWREMKERTERVISLPTESWGGGFDLIRMEMPFNSDEWRSLPVIPGGDMVLRVDLVSTSYRESSSFNQDQLDRDRIARILSTFPTQLSDAMIEWRRVIVTGPKENSDARKTFHGFIVLCRKAPTKESMKVEIDDLKKAFAPVTSDAHTLHKIAVEISDGSGRTVIDTIARFSEGMFGTDFGDSRLSISSYHDPGTLPAWTGFSDTVVSAVFKRHPEWNKMLVVCDVTGSMSPYTYQLFAWYKLNTIDGKVKDFVFFNDGDMKPDNMKTAGSTGGIYSVTANGFESVMGEATHAMMNGGGGDCPENNVEALNYGLKEYPEANDIVMIADNWATPRDMAFAASVDKPVHIIVCGAFMGINTAYLDLALKTGGTVHTMEQDLTELARMNDGQVISLGKFSYKLQGGHFIPVSGS